jgi:hypothetical protein
MGPLWKRLWNDPAYFTASVRGLVQMLGALVAAGLIPTGSNLIWKQVGLIVIALGGFMPAGNKTPPAPTLLEIVRGLSLQDRKDLTAATLNPQLILDAKEEAGGGGK